MHASHQNNDLIQDLKNVLAKHGVRTAEDAPVPLNVGSLTIEQLNHVFRNIPIDVAFIDENEIVQFYSETPHRVFPRTPGIIGKTATECHPKKSQHIVAEIIEKFKSGEESEVEFWINKPGVFIYMYYVAARDEDGNFKGILEVMQDLTHLRSLEGSQTQLTWGSGKQSQETDDDKTASPSERSANEGQAHADRAAVDCVDPAATGERLETAIIPETRLLDLLEAYPGLKKELVKIDDKFKILSTPLGRMMLPKATVAIMAERTDRSVEEMIELLSATVLSLRK